LFLTLEHDPGGIWITALVKRGSGIRTQLSSIQLPCFQTPVNCLQSYLQSCAFFVCPRADRGPGIEKMENSLALLYAALNDVDRAFEFLERAVNEHDSQLISVTAEPLFDHLRPDHRYCELLTKMGLNE
jgi:hypothetical protein